MLLSESDEQEGPREGKGRQGWVEAASGVRPWGEDCGVNGDVPGGF